VCLEVLQIHFPHNADPVFGDALILAKLCYFRSAKAPANQNNGHEGDDPTGITQI
jgi:hypothetical protein